MSLPPPNAHATTYRVCYADTDQMGRVYYGNYFVLLERARTELLRAAGVPYRALEERGCLLPVRRCEARYRGWAGYDDELTLLTWVSRLRHATVRFETAVSREGTRIVEGTVELACIAADGRPQPFPPDAVEALGPYLAAGS